MIDDCQLAGHHSSTKSLARHYSEPFSVLLKRELSWASALNVTERVAPDQHRRPRVEIGVEKSHPQRGTVVGKHFAGESCSNEAVLIRGRVLVWLGLAESVEHPSTAVVGRAHGASCSISVDSGIGIRLGQSEHRCTVAPVRPVSTHGMRDACCLESQAAELTCENLDRPIRIGADCEAVKVGRPHGTGCLNQQLTRTTTECQRLQQSQRRRQSHFVRLSEGRAVQLAPPQRQSFGDLLDWRAQEPDLRRRRSVLIVEQGHSSLIATSASQGHPAGLVRRGELC